jgi:hypothetical protein
MASKIPEFSNEVIVTSIGITVVQALDFLASEMNLSEEDTQQLWSPFLAATARLIKPADDMAETFLHSSKTKKVKAAISSEINKPCSDFYEPFNESSRKMLNMLTESVGDVGYLFAIENQGLFNKTNMAADVMDMLNFYIEDQNSKGRKIQRTDEVFKSIFCTVLPQHVEDTMQGNSLNGVKNTGQIIKAGQVVLGQLYYYKLSEVCLISSK